MFVRALVPLALIVVLIGRAPARRPKGTTPRKSGTRSRPKTS